MKKQLLSLSVIAMTSMPVMASDFYVVADLGRSKFEVDSDSKSETAFSLGGGYKFNNNFAIEVAYRDFGEISESYEENLGGGDFYREKYTFGASALQVSLVASLPISQSVNLYGRLGIADMDFEASESYEFSWDGEMDQDSASGSVSKNKTVFGVGIGYAVTPALSLRAEYSQYDKWEELEISTVSAGIAYQF